MRRNLWGQVTLLLQAGCCWHCFLLHCSQNRAGWHTPAIYMCSPGAAAECPASGILATDHAPSAHLSLLGPICVFHLGNSCLDLDKVQLIPWKYPLQSKRLLAADFTLLCICFADLKPSSKLFPFANTRGLLLESLNLG